MLPPSPRKKDQSSAVQVAVRIRPFLPNEAGNDKCVEAHHSRKRSSKDADLIQIGGDTGKSFVFDRAFDTRATQKQVFVNAVSPLVASCLEGYNATVLAYGQTGSGKTFTILGPSTAASFDGDHDEVQYGSGISAMSGATSQAGVIPRALRELFQSLERQQLSHSNDENDDDDDDNDEKTPPYEYEVRVQFLELYGEEIRDLLSASLTRLAIRDGGPSLEPEVIGALEVKVSTAAEALLCLTRGSLRRVTAATAMNAESSRSHAIMTVIVEQRTIIKATEDTGHPDIESKRSKFHFVDLAGSERQKKSLAVGKRLKEGIDINKGLLVLGNVISALGDPKKRGKTFVPYRDSKLTRLLKGSLGGNHKTLMIACVSPSSSNMEESLNCLRYANRAKNIQNNAVVNVDAGSRLVAELRDQIKALAGELLGIQGDDDEGKLFPSGILRSLAKGDDSTGMDLYGGANGHSNSNIENGIGSRKKELELRRRLEQFNDEKKRFQQTIKQLKGNLDSKSDELFAAQAEKEFYRLQMPQNEGGNYYLNPNQEEKYDDIVGSKASFINRIIEYEREIALLKEQVRESKTTSVKNGFHENFNGDAHSSITADTETSRSISTPPKSPDDSFENSRRRKASSRNKRRSPFDKADREARKEQQEIDLIAKRYMKLGHEGDVNIEDDDDDGLQSLESILDEDDPEETFRNRQAEMDAHLLQLNKGIEEKQELIAQLHRSQTKYETMKEFYHEKVRNMSKQLKERETERLELLHELMKLEENTENYRALQAELQAKENHIEHLRSRQEEISALSQIASRNESVIQRLNSDISEMKKQKGDMQRQLTKERKQHQQSIQQYRKEAIIQERDANKTKQELAKVTMQKERVQNIAKVHAEEISKLRGKYRDAEKKLRMQTLKKGVMERAGIDPVLLGRKDNSAKTRRTGNGRTPPERKAHSSSDIHQFRSFLEEKVEEVGRKENTADKLAIEWENHLDLSRRKDDLMLEVKDDGKTHLMDEVEALDFQIQYKESRIRQLASRLKERPRSRSTSSSRDFLQNTLIDDRNFRKMSSHLSPLNAAQLSSKVLFGMVVKERRRVATLARAASALDQKAMDAQKLASSKEAALKSYMDESKHEKVALVQNHQDKILSLMSIVHQEDQLGQAGGVSRPTSAPDSVVLTIANEKIDALESQIEMLKDEKERREDMETREKEVVDELNSMTMEYGELMKESKKLKYTLVKLRDLIKKSGEMSNEEPLLAEKRTAFQQEILSLVEDVINQSLVDAPKDSEIPSPQNKSRRDSLFAIDSEDEYDGQEGVPEWAGHIMEDLAIIAAGDIPPSLEQNKRPPLSNNLLDQNSVDSRYARNSNRNRRPNVNVTPTRSIRNVSPGRARRSNSTPKKRSDEPPRMVSLDKFLGTNQSRDASPKSERSSFVEEYTQKNVFERLQKKVTNSYSFSLRESMSQGDDN